MLVTLIGKHTLVKKFKFVHRTVFPHDKVGSEHETMKSYSAYTGGGNFVHVSKDIITSAVHCGPGDYMVWQI